MSSQVQPPSSLAQFFRFLVTIRLLPVTLDTRKHTINFKFWSMATIVHFVIYWLPCITINGLIGYFNSKYDYWGKTSKSTSMVEEMSGFLAMTVQLALCFPLLICYRIKNNRAAIFNSPHAKFPEHGFKNILAIFLQFIGGVTYASGLVGKFNGSMRFYDSKSICLLVLHSCVVLYITVFWALGAFVVQTWIEYSKVDSLKAGQDFVMNCNRYIGNYENFSKSLTSFFFTFFSVIQFSTIINIFLSLSKFVIKVSIKPKYLIALLIMNHSRKNFTCMTTFK